jgi:hypothetical protein
MKISIRDLLWLTVLVAVLLAWRLQWQEFQRERDARRQFTIQLLSQQYATQEAEVNQLAAKVKAAAALESTLQLEFAQADLKRAKAFRDAIAARIAKLSDDARAPGK